MNGNSHFVTFSNGSPPELRDGEGLDTLVLEQEMIGNNGGLDLSKLDPEQIVGDDLYELFVPHFWNGKGKRGEEKVIELTNRYPDIKKPCSMSLSSAEELFKHMSIGYQVAHFHYILGKKHNLKGSFPRMCCGLSSRNVMLSLMEFGYPNATYAYSNSGGHGCTILPFVIERGWTRRSIKGTIVIDPTSDQLWDKPGVRNAVFLKLGKKWEYRTDWRGGADLFPDEFCSIDVVREIPNDLEKKKYSRHEAKDYFRKAFSNPVKI